MTSSLRTLVDDFKKNLTIPNNVLIWISKERKFVITVYCIKKDISVKEELDYLNVLHKYHGLARMKLSPFEVTEIISIIKNYLSMFIFTSRKQCKKMSVVVHPTKIFDYFNNILDQDKAKQLHSFCVVRSICYIATLITDHGNNYRCFCFKCRICRLLIKYCFLEGMEDCFVL